MPNAPSTTLVQAPATVLFNPHAARDQGTFAVGAAEVCGPDPGADGTVRSGCYGRSDAGFPERLRILPALAAVWLRGDATVLSRRPCVTLIGSRAASPAGVRLATELGAALARRSALVVSGGALGIDAAAHQGALLGGGATCAVLGTGVDVAYPRRHAALFAAIAERGLLMSMFPPGSPPQDWHFPVRNQLMAALSDLVVLVEAQPGSGTRHTARFARGLGRTLAAVPGSPGADETLREGAHAVRSIEDVLRLVDEVQRRLDAGLPPSAAKLEEEPRVRTRRRDARRGAKNAQQQPGLPAAFATEEEPLGGAAAQIFSALGRGPLDVSELCARTGLAAAQCAAALIDLELRGRCTRLPGGRYLQAPRD